MAGSEDGPLLVPCYVRRLLGSGGPQSRVYADDVPQGANRERIRQLLEVCSEDGVSRSLSRAGNDVMRAKHETPCGSASMPAAYLRQAIYA